MFKHLLVPLDGSRLAEAAVPAAVHLAMHSRASITLVHVIEKNAPKEIHGDRHLTTEDEACRYLGELALALIPAEIPCDQHVHTTEVSDVARSIIDHEGEFSPDLVVMCSHGSGGLRDWLYGTIAQQVIANGKTPVLLIQPSESRAPAKFTCGTLLLPVDGDPEHEQGLLITTDLASACQTRIHLLAVVPTMATLRAEGKATGLLLPFAMKETLNLAEEGAQTYLQEKMIKLQEQGIPATSEVSRGDPATVIIEVAVREKVDLIVLGTHGKSGQDAFWAGSVANKVSNQTHIPLLLVPVRE